MVGTLVGVIVGVFVMVGIRVIVGVFVIVGVRVVVGISVIVGASVTVAVFVDVAVDVDIGSGRVLLQPRMLMQHKQESKMMAITIMIGLPFLPVFQKLMILSKSVFMVCFLLRDVFFGLLPDGVTGFCGEIGPQAGEGLQIGIGAGKVERIIDFRAKQFSKKLDIFRAWPSMAIEP